MLLLLLPLLFFGTLVRWVFQFSLFRASCSQPALSFVLFDFPSLESLNTVICASHLQHDHWRPLGLTALDAFVSVSALAMCPVHPSGSVCLSSIGSISYLFMITCPFLCLSFPPFCWKLFLLLSSVLLCPQPLSLSMLSVCLPNFLLGATLVLHNMLGQTVFASASIPLVEGHVRTTLLLFPLPSRCCMTL